MAGWSWRNGELRMSYGRSFFPLRLAFLRNEQVYERKDEIASAFRLDPIAFSFFQRKSLEGLLGRLVAWQMLHSACSEMLMGISRIVRLWLSCPSAHNIERSLPDFQSKHRSQQWSSNL